MSKWLTRESLTAVLLVVVLLFSGSVWWSLRGLRAGIQQVIEEHEVPMQTVSQTVTNSAGDSFVITTVKIDGESLADWRQRHIDAVEEFQDN